MRLLLGLDLTPDPSCTASARFDRIVAAVASIRESRPSARNRRPLAGLGFPRMGTTRARAALALALLVPAPTLGALAAFVLAPGPLGQAVYFACKVWIAALPFVWLVRVERGRPSLSPLPRGRRASALGAGALLGIALAAAVALGYELFGRELLDADRLRAVLASAGLGTRARYLAFGAYLIFVNSLVEELVWRWFVFRRCEELLPSAVAVVASAASFTLHHALVFHVQFGAAAGALASAGVFAGGIVWSWCYLRWRPIWPGYVSHVVVDLAGLAIGWRLLLG